MIDINDLYAKPDKKLINHLYEAGLMAEELLRHGRGYHAVSVMSERFNIDKEELISSVCFLCANHDIGKAHPGFLRSMAETNGDIVDHVTNLSDKKLILDEDEHIRHERYSREILYKYMIDKGFDKYLSEDVSMIVAYHHQGKGPGVSEPVFCYKKNSDRWNEWNNIHEEIISKIEEHWNLSSDLKKICDKNGINGLLYLILSVMVTSDWIVSGKLWNEYIKCGDVRYSAKSFVSENYLSFGPLSDVFDGCKWKDIFDFPKNNLQMKISETDMSYSSLILIEMPCGYGKTEAALISALKAGRGCGGIYFAAPTMATAKALAKRCAKMAKKANLPITIPELDSSMIWSDEDMNKINPELWTSRKRHELLYPFAVGTIDQILKTVLSFRYSCIGTLGLSDKAVIIDEVHAYDDYMLTELKELIKWCRFFKVPVILLSATLPTKTKKELFDAAGVKKDVEVDKRYPLISMVKESLKAPTELYQIKTEASKKIYPLRVVNTGNMLESMYKEAMDHKEGVLALITPTVDFAFDLYDMVSKDVTDCEVILFHGRDTINHKSEKTEKLLKLLGKDRSERPKKLILIATSIIEQSLDIDIDKMVTAIAPIDLLIQRLGRVMRHKDEGTIREKIHIDYPFTVLIPSKYGSLGRIYGRDVLLATQMVLERMDKIDTIDDIRALIDQVYDNIEPDTDTQRMYAGYQCLDTPFKDESTIISSDDADKKYFRFNKLMPATRDESYKTLQIAILDKEPDSISFEDMKKIMYENVVSVAEYKIKDGDNYIFKTWDNDIKWLKDIPVFIGSDFRIENTDKGMVLTKDGLRFYERG